MTLRRLRGDKAAAVSEDELVSYLQACGVDGNAVEILGIIRARLARVELVTAFGGWMGWMPALDFRVGLRNVSSVVSGVRRGVERKEIKLRQRWRRRADSCRPTNLKGAANRGGGSRRRGPERAVGHKGGAMARAMQREAGDATGIKRRKTKRCDTLHVLQRFRMYFRANHVDIFCCNLAG